MITKHQAETIAQACLHQAEAERLAKRYRRSRRGAAYRSVAWQALSPALRREAQREARRSLFRNGWYVALLISAVAFLAWEGDYGYLHPQAIHRLGFPLAGVICVLATLTNSIMQHEVDRIAKRMQHTLRENSATNSVASILP